MNQIIYLDLPDTVSRGIRKKYDESTGEDYYIVALNSRYNWEALEVAKLQEADLAEEYEGYKKDRSCGNRNDLEKADDITH